MPQLETLFPSMMNKTITILYSQMLKKYAIRFLLLLLNPLIIFFTIGSVHYHEKCLFTTQLCMIKMLSHKYVFVAGIQRNSLF